MIDLRRNVIPWALVLLAGGGVFWGYISHRHATERERARRHVERELAAERKVVAARTATVGELRAALVDAGQTSSVLRDQLRRLRASFPDARPEVVTRWRTKIVEVEVPVPAPPEAREDCPQSTDPPSGVVPLELSAEGTTANLRSEAGTWFVVGSVEVTAASVGIRRGRCGRRVPSRRNRPGVLTCPYRSAARHRSLEGLDARCALPVERTRCGDTRGSTIGERGWTGR